jgi:hypothetical protein
MDVIAEAVEELPQYELRAGVDVDVALGHAERLGEQPAQRRRVRLGASHDS